MIIKCMSQGTPCDTGSPRTFYGGNICSVGENAVLSVLPMVVPHKAAAATLTGNKVSHKIWSILKYYIYSRKYMVQPYLDLV